MVRPEWFCSFSESAKTVSLWFQIWSYFSLLHIDVVVCGRMNCQIFSVYAAVVVVVRFLVLFSAAVVVVVLCLVVVLEVGVSDS